MIVSINDIWVEFSLPLKGFISKRISNAQDVDDVLQDVYIKIHQNSANLKDNTKIHAWVYKITRNAVADYYRKKGAWAKDASLFHLLRLYLRKQ